MLPSSFTPYFASGCFPPEIAVERSSNVDRELADFQRLCESSHKQLSDPFVPMKSTAHKEEKPEAKRTVRPDHEARSGIRFSDSMQHALISLQGWIPSVAHASCKYNNFAMKIAISPLEDEAQANKLKSEGP